MIDLLLAEGGGTATTLSEDLPVTRQAISKHLAVLDRVGLVARHGGRTRAALSGGRGPARPRGRPARRRRRQRGTHACDGSSRWPRRSQRE